MNLGTPTEYLLDTAPASLCNFYCAPGTFLDPLLTPLDILLFCKTRLQLYLENYNEMPRPCPFEMRLINSYVVMLTEHLRDPKNRTGYGYKLTNLFPTKFAI